MPKRGFRRRRDPPQAWAGSLTKLRRCRNRERSCLVRRGSTDGFEYGLSAGDRKDLYGAVEVRTLGAGIPSQGAGLALPKSPAGARTTDVVSRAISACRKGALNGPPRYWRDSDKARCPCHRLLAEP